MTTVDTFGVYIRHRLERWGDVFALNRDYELLGHQSKNMLQVLIEHKGEMPARATGFKPMEIDQAAWEIELIVTEIARTNTDVAACMRGYYCGSGRRKVERYEQAVGLIRKWRGADCAVPNVQRYLILVSSGSERVRGRLEAVEPRATA